GMGQRSRHSQIISSRPRQDLAIVSAVVRRRRRSRNLARPRERNRRTNAPGKELAMTKVWLITGASRGFGRVWAQAALQRGDSVAATARDTRTLEDLAAAHGERLLALQLDGTAK